MDAEIYKVSSIGAGFLAVMAKPVGEWLDEEIASLARQGVTTVVSLLTHAEAYELGLVEEAALCSAQGIEFLSFPITDRGVPEQVAMTVTLVAGLHERALAGSGVVVHCRAGIGRSGLIAAAVLLHEGLTPESALATVSRARRVPVPDTEEQVRWLCRHASLLRG